MADAQDKPKATFCTNVQLPPGVHDFEADTNDLCAEIDIVIDGKKNHDYKNVFYPCAGWS